LGSGVLPRLLLIAELADSVGAETVRAGAAQGARRQCSATALARWGRGGDRSRELQS